MIKIIITLLLFFTTVLMADGHVSIDTQIAAIKNASPSQRVKLMNAFKTRVSQMNTQERSVAIKNMYSKMASKNSSTRSPNIQQTRMPLPNIHKEHVEHQRPSHREDIEPPRENPRRK